jgi:radical SAM superfamily enzyme YgiQ (UPF0313 family)
MRNEILLVLPPFFTPLTPPLGISILKSYLEENGYSVTCFDFNTLAQQWNVHHQYFARLQSLESVSIQDGYSKLWHILNDHMLAHMNGTAAEDLMQLLPRIISQYGMKSEPLVVEDLISLVERYFRGFEATLFELFDFSKYSHVGTSTYTTSLSSSLYLLRAVKQRFPWITTIMGGGVFADDLALGSDNLDTLIREYSFLDHIVIGEGEGLLLKLLRGELKDQRLITSENVQGVNLDMLEVPVPSFKDFNMQEYYHLTIEGARSCPFQCSFCSETIQWGKYRKKPARILAGQMIRLAESYGNNTFFMGDSLMNPYIDELARVLLEKQGQVLYDGYLRADKPVTHRDRANLWARSGLVRVRMGIESASTRVLGMMDKMTTPQTIAETLKSLASAGVRTTTYWIVGYPGETQEDFQETLDFVRENYRYIYELEAHPHLYYPYGQVASRLYKSVSVYPDEVNRFTKFQKWEVTDTQPGREEKFDRLRQLSELAAELGLINIYSEEARYRAEARWHSLYPLVTEVAKGTRLRRGTERLPDSPRETESALLVCAEAPPAEDGVVSYGVAIKKNLDQDLLRVAIDELIRNNEILQDVPIKLALVQKPNPPHELFLLASRFLLDGRSLTLLMEDLFRIYEQLANEKEISLLPVGITYPEFVREEKRVPVVKTGPHSMVQVESIVLPFDSELSRRLFATTLDRCDFRPAEVFVLALQRVFAEDGLVFDIDDDYRNVDDRLTRTVGPLTYRREVYSGSDGVADTNAVRFLLNFEYLVPEPWLGGDEWVPQGFETFPQQTSGSSSVQLMPVCTRRGLEVHLQYTELELVQTVTDLLLAEVSAILDHCEHYVAAERFWLNEFDRITPRSPLIPHGLDISETENPWETAALVIERESLDHLRVECSSDSSVIMLAAYGLLLSRLNGVDDLVLMMAHTDGVQTIVVPIRLRPLGHLSFRNFTAELNKNIEQILRYGTDAFEILTKAGKLSENSTHFDFGIQISTEHKQTLANHELAGRDLKLVLSVSSATDETTIECAYLRTHFERQSMEAFLDCLSQILEAARSNVEVSLAEINLNHDSTKLPPAILQDAVDTFCFS